MNIIFFIDEINSNSGFNYEIKYAKRNIESLSIHKVFLVDYSESF